MTAEGTRHPITSNTSIDDVLEMLEAVIERTEDAEQSLPKQAQAPSDLQRLGSDASASERQVPAKGAGDGKSGDSE